MKSKLTRAVIEQHAPKLVRTDTPEQTLFRKLNYFPTPPWAARAIAYRLSEFDPDAKTIDEPACGEGHFAEPLKEIYGGDNVWCSDIYDYGYGEVRDFLDLRDTRTGVVDWVVTNPPFDYAREFVERGLQRARRGVVTLCRMAFLETQGRQKLLYESEHPLTCMMPFVERVPMHLGRWEPDGDTMTASAAFVFSKHHAPRAPWPFLTGTERRFTRHDDAARFAKPSPIPLFSKMAPSALESAARASGQSEILDHA